MSKVAVVGAGFVGLTTAVVLAERGEAVVIVESNGERVTSLRAGVVPFYEPGLTESWRQVLGGVQVVWTGDPAAERAMRNARLTMLCVPTPTGEDGGHDVSAVHSAAAAWARAQGEPEAWGMLAIRSTVLPEVPQAVLETVRSSRPDAKKWAGLSYMPEFLAEGTALRDTRLPIRVVTGWVEPSKIDRLSRDRVESIVNRPGVPYLDTSAETASMLKYASNTMLATRISAMQDIGEVCGRVGADITVVSEALGHDARIGSEFLSAGAGWGGSCFPKDTRALAHLAKRVGLTGGMAEAACLGNDSLAQRWVVEAVVKHGATPLRVAWLGVSFKPGTSDIRESPSLAALKAFRAEFPDAEIRIHDPKANVAREGVRVVGSVLDACRGADVVVLATAWEDYKNTLPSILRASVNTVLILDTRNLWNPKSKELPDGSTYMPFGRPSVSG